MLDPEPGASGAAAKSFFLVRLYVSKGFDNRVDVARVCLQKGCEHSESDLIRHRLGNFSVDLAKNVNALFFVELVVALGLVDSVNNALCLVVVLVNFKNVKVKTDGKFCVGAGSRKDVAENFGAITFPFEEDIFPGTPLRFTKS